MFYFDERSKELSVFGDFPTPELKNRVTTIVRDHQAAKLCMVGLLPNNFLNDLWKESSSISTIILSNIELSRKDVRTFVSEVLHENKVECLRLWHCQIREELAKTFVDALPMATRLRSFEFMVDDRQDDFVAREISRGEGIVNSNIRNLRLSSFPGIQDPIPQPPCSRGWPVVDVHIDRVERLCDVSALVNILQDNENNSLRKLTVGPRCVIFATSQRPNSLRTNLQSLMRAVAKSETLESFTIGYVGNLAMQVIAESLGTFTNLKSLHLHSYVSASMESCLSRKGLEDSKILDELKKNKTLRAATLHIHGYRENCRIMEISKLIHLFPTNRAVREDFVLKYNDNREPIWPHMLEHMFRYQYLDIVYHALRERMDILTSHRRKQPPCKPQ